MVRAPTVSPTTAVAAADTQPQATAEPVRSPANSAR